MYKDVAQEKWCNSIDGEQQIRMPAGILCVSWLECYAVVVVVRFFFGAHFSRTSRQGKNAAIRGQKAGRRASYAIRLHTFEVKYYGQ